VVEEPADVIPIERTHEYRGLYHVLGGALSPIDGVDAEDLKIAELLRRVDGGERARGRPRHQPDHDRRGDRAAHRRAAARQVTVTASPAGCRSAPTSSTRTR
jgi:recombination protein RecR